MPPPCDPPATPSMGAPPATVLPEIAAAARPEADSQNLATVAPEALVLVSVMVATLKGRMAGAAPRRFDLTSQKPEGRRLLDDILGTGEVLFRIAPPSHPTGGDPAGGWIEGHEAVMAGVWRLTEYDPAGRPRRHWIDIAEVPQAITEARPTGRPADLRRDPRPESDAVRALLEQIAHSLETHDPDGDNGVIPLSLLPLTPGERARLFEHLGQGPVRLLSRGYGTCEIQATGIANLWALRYLNASDSLLFETLEVGGLPAAARATPEDMADSARRLAALREAYL